MTAIDAPVGEIVPTSDLQFYKDNPREGDVAAIASSLQALGQYKPIVVNRGTHTGRTNEVLAGNHTLKAARSLEWAEIAVVFIDVDDTQAATIVLADNKIADLGGYDSAILADLLQDLPDLTVTGYTYDELDDLLADAREAAESAVSAQAGEAPAKEKADKYGDNDSGMLNRKSLDEKLEGYTTSDSRSIILSYIGDTYVWAVEKLAEIGDELDTASNADTVKALIERYTGETAPAVTPAATDDDVEQTAE